MIQNTRRGRVQSTISIEIICNLFFVLFQLLEIKKKNLLPEVPTIDITNKYPRTVIIGTILLVEMVLK